MAISENDFFTVLGKIFQAQNAYKASFATFTTNREELVQELVDIDLDAIADGLSNSVSSHISGLTAGCNYFTAKANELLFTPENLARFPITSVSLQNVLQATYDIMVAGASSINQGLTTVGSITKSAAGAGTSDIIYSTVLDKISVPVSGGVALDYPFPTNSELGATGNVYAKCTSADAAGSEVLTLFGSATAVGPFEEQDETIGGSVSLPCGDLQNLIESNAGFETYSAPNFTGWTVDDAGGTIAQETSLMFRGASALRINTLANADTISLSKTLAVALTRGKGYFVGVRFRSVAAEVGNNAAWTFKIGDGTSNAQNTASVTLNSTSYQLAYALVVYNKAFSLTAPSVVTIEMSPTADGVDGVIIDDAFVIPATYFNGVAYAHINGSIQTALNDLFTIPITRTSGVIQDSFRKNWGVQMPSVNDASETYADTLAT